MKLTKTFLIGSIPNINKTIRPTSRESSVLSMKSDGVHGENVFDAVFFRSMTFKSVFFLLNFGIGIEKFYSDST